MENRIVHHGKRKQRAQFYQIQSDGKKEYALLKMVELDGRVIASIYRSKWENNKTQLNLLQLRGDGFWKRICNGGIRTSKICRLLTEGL